MEENNVILKIENSRSHMSKSHKLIADFVCKQYDKAAFMTAAKLGEKVGVSESTVVRFASELGYDGYPDFQRVLREIIKSKLTAVQRMEITSSKFAEKDILSTVLTSDIEKLRQTLETVSVDDFSSAVDSITKAKRIYVLGGENLLFNCKFSCVLFKSYVS